MGFERMGVGKRIGRPSYTAIRSIPLARLLMKRRASRSASKPGNFGEHRNAPQGSRY